MKAGPRGRGTVQQPGGAGVSEVRREGRGRRRRTVMVRAVLAVIVVVSGLATVAVTARPAAAASYQDWPMFLQNASRTDATVDPNLSVAKASILKEKWAFATGGPVASSVSIVGTTAYFGSWDGYEYAVNTATGAEIWKSPSLGVTTNNNCYPGHPRHHLGADHSQRRALRGWRGRLLVRPQRGHRSHRVGRLHRLHYRHRRPLQLVEPAHLQRLRLHRHRLQLRQPTRPGPAPPSQPHHRDQS